MKTRVYLAVVVLLVLLSALPGQAQGPEAQAVLGTSFTYQGQLKSSGTPVQGSCDFQFSLWTAATGGSQVGTTQTKTGVAVTRGLFTAPIDFGVGAFQGDARHLAIALRCPAGSGSYVMLSPRQAVTAAPYALALPGLWTQPNATSPNIIGGYSGNQITTGVYGAVIGGGGASGNLNLVTDNYGVVAGGYGNQAGDNAGTTDDCSWTTIGGGVSNKATGYEATVGGGTYNTASGAQATVGGGGANIASNNNATIGGGMYNAAAGVASFIGGGNHNFILDTGLSAVIVGGDSNVISGTTPFSSAIVGGRSNRVSGESSFIGGGDLNNVNGDYSAIGGGYENVVSATKGFIGGGLRNSADGVASFIGAGGRNTVSWSGAFIGAGIDNEISTFAAYSAIVAGVYNVVSGLDSFIGSGKSNAASGDYSVIPGGFSNEAAGNYSFAAGRRAKAMGEGCFVWGDATDRDVICLVPNSWVVRASGGFTFYTNATATTGVKVTAGGGSWSSVSDRNLKANFAPVNGQDVLRKLASIPIDTWNYKSQNASIRHIGPVAQDFAAAFGVGEDDVSISTVDADGVALAAIQGLYEIVQEKDARIAALEAENANLQSRMAALEAIVAQLVEK